MQVKRLSIDKQLHLGWSLLYELEVIEDMAPIDILERLNTTSECIANIRARKRLSTNQQEKLINLEKWYQSYDIKRLQKDIKKQNKLSKKRLHH